MLRSRRLYGLGVLAGFYAAGIPWIATWGGLTRLAPLSREVVDHLVPGLLIAAVGVLALRRAPLQSDVRWYVGAAWFVCGFWIVATHLSPVQRAVAGEVNLPTALLHASAGVLVLALGVATMLVKRGNHL